VATSVTGDQVELDVDAGEYRISAAFDRSTMNITSFEVAIRPERQDRPTPPDEPEPEEPVDQWEAAGSFLSKVASFGMAVGSKLIDGPVEGPELDYRVQCCFGKTMAGVEVNAPCPSLVTKDAGNSYCRSCGCEKSKLTRRLAQLNPRKPDKWNTSKLAYPYLKCPRGRFSPVAGPSG
jgi:hypothetical protein